jgi:hypothetical protein
VDKKRTEERSRSGWLGLVGTGNGEEQKKDKGRRGEVIIYRKF